MAVKGSEFQTQLNDLMYNQFHMSARGLRYLRMRTGADESSIAAVIVAVFALYLVNGESAQFAANAILTGVPISLTYVYPLEMPDTPLLLVYWAAFGVVTLFDSTFEEIHGYYLLKVVLMSLMFLRPLNGAKKLLIQIRSITGQKTDSLTEDISRRLRTLKASETEMKAVDSESSRIRRRSQDFSEGANPMLTDSAYRVGDNNSPTSVTSSTTVVPMNPHDLTFEPSKYLVFNGPFNENTTTYYMSITNTSQHLMAFAIKSNAIPRIVAFPPSGLIKAKQKLTIAITLAKFEYNEALVAKDRIAFDYAFCPPDTQKFSFKLLQVGEGEVRRRKNIYVKYNP